MEEFLRKYLRHVKGEWAGQPLRLMPWQRERIVKPFFNTLRDDGLRQYRICYAEVPRGNMKSTTAAALGLYWLYADDEPGAEVISAAADRDQAAVVFDIARSMVEASPVLSALTKIYRRELVVPSTGHSRYRVISSEAYSKHGMNISGLVVDEVHAHESRDLIDTLLTGRRSRRQPGAFLISTAGYDRHSICWEFHERARQVLEGVIVDPSFLPVLYGAAETDDWTDPAVWAKANPGLGVSVKRDYLEQECQRAQTTPGYEFAFKRLHLNLWTAVERKWLDLARWDACGPLGSKVVGGATISISPRQAFLGLDLSTTVDLSALVILQPLDEGGYAVTCEFWCPEDTLVQRARQDHVPYPLWAEQGWLHVTPGNTVDYSFIATRLHELMAELDVAEVAVDPWNARGFIAQLQADGVPAVPVPQTMANLTSASKALEQLVLAGQLRHDGHPIARWCVSNAVADVDGNGNLKPSKKRSTERIDFVSALVTALARALVVTGSVYEGRDPVLVDL